MILSQSWRAGIPTHICRRQEQAGRDSSDKVAGGVGDEVSTRVLPSSIAAVEYQDNPACRPEFGRFAGPLWTWPEPEHDRDCGPLRCSAGPRQRAGASRAASSADRRLLTQNRGAPLLNPLRIKRDRILEGLADDAATQPRRHERIITTRTTHPRRG